MLKQICFGDKHPLQDYALQIKTAERNWMVMAHSQDGRPNQLPCSYKQNRERIGLIQEATPPKTSLYIDSPTVVPRALLRMSEEVYSS